MLRGALAAAVEHALVSAAIAYEQVGTERVERDRVLAAIRARGVALVEERYAPHTIEAVNVIARFDEERIGRLLPADADDLAAICCYIGTATDEVLAVVDHLRGVQVDLEAQRFSAWSRNDQARVLEAIRAGEAVEELLAGVRTAGSAFAFPAGRAATVRDWIGARPDLS